MQHNSPGFSTHHDADVQQQFYPGGSADPDGATPQQPNTFDANMDVYINNVIPSSSRLTTSYQKCLNNKFENNQMQVSPNYQQNLQIHANMDMCQQNCNQSTARLQQRPMDSSDPSQPSSTAQVQNQWQQAFESTVSEHVPFRQPAQSSKHQSQFVASPSCEHKAIIFSDESSIYNHNEVNQQIASGEQKILTTPSSSTFCKSTDQMQPAEALTSIKFQDDHYSALSVFSQSEYSLNQVQQSIHSVLPSLDTPNQTLSDVSDISLCKKKHELRTLLIEYSDKADRCLTSANSPGFENDVATNVPNLVRLAYTNPIDNANVTQLPSSSYASNVSKSKTSADKQTAHHPAVITAPKSSSQPANYLKQCWIQEHSNNTGFIESQLTTKVTEEFAQPVDAPLMSSMDQVLTDIPAFTSQNNKIHSESQRDEDFNQSTKEIETYQHQQALFVSTTKVPSSNVTDKLSASVTSERKKISTEVESEATNQFDSCCKIQQHEKLLHVNLYQCENSSSEPSISRRIDMPTCTPSSSSTNNSTDALKLSSNCYAFSETENRGKSRQVSSTPQHLTSNARSLLPNFGINHHYLFDQKIKQFSSAFVDPADSAVALTNVASYFPKAQEKERQFFSYRENAEKFKRLVQTWTRQQTPPLQLASSITLYQEEPEKVPEEIYRAINRLKEMFSKNCSSTAFTKLTLTSNADQNRSVNHTNNNDDVQLFQGASRVNLIVSKQERECATRIPIQEISNVPQLPASNPFGSLSSPQLNNSSTCDSSAVSSFSKSNKPSSSVEVTLTLSDEKIKTINTKTEALRTTAFCGDVTEETPRTLDAPTEKKAGNQMVLNTESQIYQNTDTTQPPSSQASAHVRVNIRKQKPKYALPGIKDADNIIQGTDINTMKTARVFKEVVDFLANQQIYGGTTNIQEVQVNPLKVELAMISRVLSAFESHEGKNRIDELATERLSIFSTVRDDACRNGAIGSIPVEHMLSRFKRYIVKLPTLYTIDKMPVSAFSFERESNKSLFAIPQTRQYGPTPSYKEFRTIGQVGNSLAKCTAFQKFELYMLIDLHMLWAQKFLLPKSSYEQYIEVHRIFLHKILLVVSSKHVDKRFHVLLEVSRCLDTPVERVELAGILFEKEFKKMTIKMNEYIAKSKAVDQDWLDNDYHTYIMDAIFEIDPCDTLEEPDFWYTVALGSHMNDLFCLVEEWNLISDVITELFKILLNIKRKQLILYGSKFLPNLMDLQFWIPFINSPVVPATVVSEEYKSLINITRNVKKYGYTAKNRPLASSIPITTELRTIIIQFYTKLQLMETGHFKEETLLQTANQLIANLTKTLFPAVKKNGALPFYDKFKQKVGKVWGNAAMSMVHSFVISEFLREWEKYGKWIAAKQNAISRSIFQHENKIFGHAYDELPIVLKKATVNLGRSGFDFSANFLTAELREYFKRSTARFLPYNVVGGMVAYLAKPLSKAKKNVFGGENFAAKKLKKESNEPKYLSFADFQKTEEYFSSHQANKQVDFGLMMPAWPKFNRSCNMFSSAVSREEFMPSVNFGIVKPSIQEQFVEGKNEIAVELFRLMASIKASRAQSTQSTNSSTVQTFPEKYSKTETQCVKKTESTTFLETPASNQADSEQSTHKLSTTSNVFNFEDHMTVEGAEQKQFRAVQYNNAWKKRLSMDIAYVESVSKAARQDKSENIFTSEVSMLESSCLNNYATTQQSCLKKSLPTLSGKRTANDLFEFTVPFKKLKVDKTVNLDDQTLILEDCEKPTSSQVPVPKPSKPDNSKQPDFTLLSSSSLLTTQFKKRVHRPNTVAKLLKFFKRRAIEEKVRNEAKKQAEARKRLIDKMLKQRLQALADQCNAKIDEWGDDLDSTDDQSSFEPTENLQQSLNKEHELMPWKDILREARRVTMPDIRDFRNNIFKNPGTIVGSTVPDDLRPFTFPVPLFGVCTKKCSLIVEVPQYMKQKVTTSNIKTHPVWKSFNQPNCLYKDFVQCINKQVEKIVRGPLEYEFTATENLYRINKALNTMRRVRDEFLKDGCCNTEENVDDIVGVLLPFDLRTHVLFESFCCVNIEAKLINLSGFTLDLDYYAACDANIFVPPAIRQIPKSFQFHNPPFMKTKTELEPHQ